MAYENDILTRNDDDELSVRVVQSTGDNPAVAYDDVYTRDDNGKLAVRVVGAGGGDTHNKGSFLTPEALRTAYPTAQPGDFAIVESTDTVWVWDNDGSQWKDGDTKGQVTSVNNQTGAVTVQETLVSGTNIKTVDGNSLLGSGNLELSTYLPYPAGWTTTGTTKAFCDDIAADTTAVEGKAYLGEVTCSDLPASMANGEVVVEIMDGTTAANKVIVLTLTSGNTAPYMWKYTYWNDGTDVSGWQTWATSAQGAKADTAVQPGDLATVATTGAYSDLTGTPTIPTAIQVSTMPTAAAGELDKIYQFVGTTDANYTNGYFYKCVSDGQDPATYSWTQTDVQPQAGGLPSQTGQSGKFLTTDGTDASWATVPSGQIIQYSTVPAASSANLGQIIQYVGATDANYTNGLFYFCYESPVNPGTYGWAQKIVDVSTPNANQKGFYLEVKNPGVIGWSTKKPLVNNTTATSALAIGDTITTTGQKCTALNAAQASGTAGIALGFGARTTGNWCCQIGPWTNSDNDTFKFGNGNGNFELMSADGTIPTDRFTTTPVADGTYVPTLTISSGTATRSWAAPGGGGSTALSLTLAAVNWSNNSITVTATGVTASNNVIVSPAPASQSAYTTAGVICTAQASDSLTFTCTTTPSSDLTVTVLII